jgi:hypothetical protein
LSFQATRTLLTALTPAPCQPSRTEEVQQRETLSFSQPPSPFSLSPRATPPTPDALSCSAARDAMPRRVMDTATGTIRYERSVHTTRVSHGCLIGG